MSKLLTRLAKNAVVKQEILKNSRFFNNQLCIPFRVPLLNMAVSGDFDGGIPSGILQIAAPPKHFKSNLMIEGVAAFQDYYLAKKEEYAIVFYDSEGGTTPKYFEDAGVDTSMIGHRMVTSIEQLTSDIANLCKDIEETDNVMICIDSIGMLPSLKAIENAENEHHVVNMTEAKQLKAMLKILTTYSTVKKIPAIIINHSYPTLEQYSREVASGGRASQYASHSVFFVTKADDKDGDEKIGHRFTLVAGLSRHVKQGSKFPITVHYQHGIRWNSGLFDLGVKFGFIKEASKGYYWKDVEETQKTRRKALERDKEYMTALLSNPAFRTAVASSYRMDVSSGDPEADDVEDDDPEVDAIVKEYTLKTPEKK